jgi:MOSC domain-containing protein YiiM
MTSATVQSILIATSKHEPMIACEHASLHANKGIVGDRYYDVTPHPESTELPDHELTLIAQEQIDYYNTLTGQHYNGEHYRRNIVTHGIDLNQLIGQDFRIGEVLCHGVQLCEPCRQLEAQLGQGLVKDMLHRGGLRAQICSSGTLHIGDVIALQSS